MRLEKLVSDVSGRLEYRLLDASFFPLSLYFTWETMMFTHRKVNNVEAVRHSDRTCVCLHLTEQLCGLFSMLSLQSLRQERVQAGVHILLSRLFIFYLHTKTNALTYIFTFQQMNFNCQHFCGFFQRKS